MESPSSAIEREVDRIRILSRSGRYAEALAAAQIAASAAPHDRDVLYLIAANQRCLNQIHEALESLQRLEQLHPRFSLLFQERGYCYTSLREASRAIDSFLRGVEINPALSASWTMLGRLYRLLGDEKNAATADAHVSSLKRLPPEIVRAGSLFSDGDWSAAEEVLLEYLPKSGDHPEALRLLGRIRHQRSMLDEAQLLLEAALKVAPHHLAARLDYVRVLIDEQKYLSAREAMEDLLKLEPGNSHYLSLYAAACVGLGEFAQAVALYRRLLAASPSSPDLYVSLGHVLQTIGQQKEAAESYKAAALVRPGFGDAWWSLANLKTYRFDQNEVEQMLTAEAAPDTTLVDHYHLCFALGKALEDRNEYAESWQFYARGNALKRAESRYDPEVLEVNTRDQIEVYTKRFFAARAGVGAPYVDPIFIVGLPRSGSTLVEQILASHSQVEGTQELAELPRLVHEINRKRLFPGVLAELVPEDFRALGERYITETRSYRKDRPFFIDKMPNNFRHIGLIHLILPRAKIIDVRREPMACCFSNLKQLFASGQEFTYSIEDIARYYRTYLHLMRHWGAVLPGRILKVSYEDIVKDLEGSVERILAFCGLTLEPACLEFYKTERAVRSPSSEQVRQPLFHEGLFQWKNFEAYLGPLKHSLGDALTRYHE